jgi:hypothetical protein
MARDVTLEELRIECCFPADDRTRAVCRAMAAADGEGKEKDGHPEG